MTNSSSSVVKVGPLRPTTNSLFRGLDMRSRFCLTIVLATLLACQIALGAPKDDINKLRGFQRVMSDLSNDFVELSNRFQEARDMRSSEIANSLGDITLLTTLQLESLKDTVVGVGLLQCDKMSTDYFREVGNQRFGESGVPTFLDLKIRDISTWISFSKDARLIAQANQLRDALRSMREAVVSMRPRYS